ncbi:MAG: carboxypeptidase-like regulatory domain-containing protein [Chloroflexi bacterium]|nr:carboxypeptidase-like regulatory domain-containing protein [Chloroflexota bacterium]
MNHLSDDQLYRFVFDPVRPTREETSHLEACAQCREQLEALHQLRTDLTVVRHSQPTAAALKRYDQLFSQVQQPPSALTRLLQQVRATLTWDSRQQPALQGIRNAASAHYRQLYTTAHAEIELLVMTRTPQRRELEGDIIALTDQAQVTPALLQLQALDAGQTIYEATSDAQGRFHLADLPPGHYQLLITPIQGALFGLEDLEIT